MENDKLQRFNSEMERIKRDIDSRRTECKELRKRIEHLENTFNTIAARQEIKLENYMPKWIAKDIPENMKIKELKYWCF